MTAIIILKRLVTVEIMAIAKGMVDFIFYDRVQPLFSFRQVRLTNIYILRLICRLSMPWANFKPRQSLHRTAVVWQNFEWWLK